MRKLLLLALTLLTFTLIAGCHPMRHHRMAGCGDCPKGMAQGQPCAMQPSAMGAAVQGQERSDVVYACNCGGDCKCNTLSKQPGNCACGKPLGWQHVLKVEGDEALLCGCAEGCKCKLDSKDPSLCGCGKPVKRVSLKGSGLFFCNCNGSCSCNTVSAAPGDCRCGMKLKQVN